LADHAGASFRSRPEVLRGDKIGWLEKEDKLVRRALTYALLAVAGMILLANRQAAAQYGYTPDGQSARYAMQPSSRGSGGNGAAPATAAGAAANNRTADSGAADSGTAENIPAPIPSEGEQPASQTVATTATDGSLLDNGLWPGAPVGPCCPNCCNGAGPPPDWSIDFGVKLLARDRPRTGGLSFTYSEIPETIGSSPILQNIPVFTQVFTTHSAGFNVAPGDYTTISHYVCRDCGGHDDFVEFSYWGFNSWSAGNTYAPGVLQQQQVITPDLSTPSFTYHIGRLNTPFKVNNTNENLQNVGNPLQSTTNFPNQVIGVVGFDGADSQGFTESSAMQNFELNFRMHPRPNPNQLVLHPDGRWRLECTPGWDMSYLAGLRFMAINESFHFLSQGNIGTFIGETQVASDPVSGQYDVRTQNDLLGFQLGGDIDYHACNWSRGVHTKLGPYVNFSRDVKDIINETAGLPSTANFDNYFDVHAQRASLVGEVSFQGTYKFRPNLIGRASYDFMWVTGLALGAEQLTWALNPAGDNMINTNGTVCYQGPRLSLEWLW
jgi:hypothetical protein